MSEDCIFPCLQCGRCADFLFRGLCKTCAPDLHARYEREMEFTARMDAAFFAKTGKTALQDWAGYEEFLGSSNAQEFVDTFRWRMDG
jgi:hypothetical protein